MDAEKIFCVMQAGSATLQPENRTQK